MKHLAEENVVGRILQSFQGMTDNVRYSQVAVMDRQIYRWRQPAMNSDCAVDIFFFLKVRGQKREKFEDRLRLCSLIRGNDD